MKVRCISKNTLQDKKDPKKFYEYNGEYEVSNERGKELIDTKYFVEVKEEKTKK